MGLDISDFRQDYTQAGLSRQDLNSDPFGQFELWFHQACEAQLLEPNAMVLGTASAQAMPCLRTVLLKFFNAQGFVFFTNYQSRKAGQIEENAQVSILFPWLALERQVQIQGTATKISTAESLKYFVTRPRSSQLGAWASPQSEVVADRQDLEDALVQYTAQFEDQQVPRPDHWGGYCLKPDAIEFWQGRPSRLHDRLLFRREDNEPWRIERLAP